MGVCLSFWSLQSRLYSESPLQEVQGSSHLTNSAVIAGHVVECHCLTKFIIFAEFFALLEQVKGTVDVLFLQIVDGKDVTYLTELLARPSELL
jgi:hypothetical protein